MLCYLCLVNEMWTLFDLNITICKTNDLNLSQSRLYDLYPALYNVQCKKWRYSSSIYLMTAEISMKDNVK
jgi:hypothetical protein